MWTIEVTPGDMEPSDGTLTTPSLLDLDIGGGDRPPLSLRMTLTDRQDLPRPPGGGSRRRRTWALQLMPHMKPRPWVALRSRFTAVPARETMTSHHGATTTPSPLTLLSTIKHNHHHRHRHHQ